MKQVVANTTKGAPAVTGIKSDWGELQGMVDDIHAIHTALGKVKFMYLSQDIEYTRALTHFFQVYEAFGSLVKKYPLG